MASASEVTFEINVRDVAYFADAIDYAKMGLIPAGAYKNRGYSIGKVDVGSVEEHYLDLLYDPQTSGGLLISVAPDDLPAMLKDFQKQEWIRKYPLSEKSRQRAISGFVCFRG